MDEKLQYNVIENTIKCWNAEGNQNLPNVLSNTDYIFDITFGNDNHLCVLTRDNVLSCYDNESTATQSFSSAHFDIEMITSGSKHACKLISDMAYTHSNELDVSYYLFCFGDNSHGQLQLPDRLKRSKDKISHLFSGPYSSCAKIKFKELICWGNNQQLLYDNANMAVQQHLWFGPGAVMLSIGAGETQCGIKEVVDAPAQNSMHCWGKCADRLCDTPEFMKQGAFHVSVGYDHACALKLEYPLIYTDKSFAHCWGGGNEYGQTSVPNLMAYQTHSIHAMNQYTCAIRDNMQVQCWGISQHVSPALLNQQRVLSTGGRHSCGLVGGQAMCWGNNWYKQAEIPQLNNYSAQKNNMNILFNYEFNRDILSIHAGWDYSCALNTHRNLFCWGLNVNGNTDVPQVENEQVDKCFQKFKQPVNHEVVDVAVGLAHVCMVQGLITCDQNEMTRNEASNAELLNKQSHDWVQCWGGANDHNQLNVENAHHTMINYGMYISGMTIGDEFTCLSYSNDINSNKTFCVGDNSSGQLDIPQDTSVQSVQEMTGGGAHVCSVNYADLKQQTILLACWGADTHGQATVPALFKTRQHKRIASISAGAAHTCAVISSFDGDDRYAGVMSCWGLSQGRSNAHSGQQLPLKVSAGFTHDCVVYTKGIGYCMGDNEEGQCTMPGVLKILNEAMGDDNMQE